MFILSYTVFLFVFKTMQVILHVCYFTTNYTCLSHSNIRAHIVIKHTNECSREVWEVLATDVILVLLNQRTVPFTYFFFLRHGEKHPSGWSLVEDSSNKPSATSKSNCWDMAWILHKNDLTFSAEYGRKKMFWSYVKSIYIVCCLV